MLGGDALHRADEPAVSAAADPGAGHGPHLPRTHLLFEAIWKARGAVQRIRSDVPRIAAVFAYW